MTDDVYAHRPPARSSRRRHEEPMKLETLIALLVGNGRGPVGISQPARRGRTWGFLAHGPGGGIDIETKTREAAVARRNAITEHLTNRPEPCVIFSFADSRDYLRWLDAVLSPPFHADSVFKHPNTADRLVRIWGDWTWPLDPPELAIRGATHDRI